MTHSLLFVDSLVADSDILLPSLDAQVRVVHLDSSRSGIAQIQEVLALESGLDSVQILSPASN